MHVTGTRVLALAIVACAAGFWAGATTRPRSSGEAEGSARAVLYQLYPQMPTECQSDDCRDGGPLDLRPQSSLWP